MLCPASALTNGKTVAIDPLSKVCFLDILLLLSGKFDETFDNYINDQFIFRDQWIMIKALFQKFTLHISNNNVYFADDHKLISQTLSYDKKQIDKNIDTVNEFIDFGNY